MEKLISLLKVMSITCISMFFFVNNLSAQTTWEEVIEQLAENEEENSYQWENLLEELADLKEHPLNINRATKEQLERFPFLSDRLIENILYYIYKYGSIQNEKELMMVEDMNRQTIRYLLPFITFQPIEKEEYKHTFNQMLKKGKHELSTRVDIPFYTKAGYKNKYLGYGFYHNVRYSYHYSDRLYIGLTAEKDAGEPFFEGKNRKGYDYYSPYFLIRNTGKIKTLAIGNYRLGYGYGLVINTGFSMGKSATLSTLGNQSKGIKKHSSTDEYNYFQGVAISYQLSKRWTADAFYSYRKMSGTVDNRFITSLKKDGYFRTTTDFNKRNSFSNHVIGSNIHYNGKYYELGLTTVYNVFNKVLNPATRYYNTYYARGSDFFNAGINYKLFYKQFTFSGETAIDKAGRIATLNMLRYSPKSDTQITVMNRFYDAAYQSIYARSVGEGSTVQNESGIYIGLETNLLRYFKLNAYADYFYFPWKKYLVSKAGTTGFDGLVQLSYSPTYELDMFIRYRYKNKQKDYTDDSKNKSTLPYIQQRWKYQLNYTPTDAWMLKTTIDYVNAHHRHQSASQGIMISQGAGVLFNNFPLRLDGHVAWFCTDDYSSRISMYEKGLLYSFSFPSFYGKGMRYALVARYEWGKHCVLQAKYGLTQYFDRETIGTALEQINKSVKSDLYLQLCFKF